MLSDIDGFSSTEVACMLLVLLLQRRVAVVEQRRRRWRAARTALERA